MDVNARVKDLCGLISSTVEAFHRSFAQKVYVIYCILDLKEAVLKEVDQFGDSTALYKSTKKGSESFLETLKATASQVKNYSPVYMKQNTSKKHRGLPTG